MARLAVETVVVAEPAYRFTIPGTLLFMSGAPLSGKSTVAPLVAANIAGCVIQNMDLMRYAAQTIDGALPEADREPTMMFGACDSFEAIGDGSYSPGTLIQGYNRHAAALCQILHGIIPGLEAQGANNVLFEGVQLLPDVIGQYLGEKNRMIVVTSDEDRFARNRQQLFGDSASRRAEHYSTDRLMLIQDELLRQADRLDAEQVFRAENTGSYVSAAAQVLGFLGAVGTIEPNV
ncbi:MAG TPA: hypothetical protein VLH84_02445 [Patescibacteria group bacterium]|nr:hypothetical protein [Patescibacteria group bacterium]